MNPDDPVCLCFHVTRRKVISFIRVEKPRRASQLSQCFGAGTGCGWCRPYLEKLLANETAAAGGHFVNSDEGFQGADRREHQETVAEITFDQYAKGRAKYVQEGGGTPPPGALPIDDKDFPKSP